MGPFKLAGVVLPALAVMMLLGLTDDFQRIDHLANGRWALKHAVRGAVATFTRDELASIEAVESRTSRSGSRYRVAVALAGGQTYSATTESATSLQELRNFATTAGLPPGKVHIRRPYGRNWTNGASGVTLKDCVGTYEYVNQQLGERSTVEFWLDGGELAGRETALDGGRKYVQSLRNIVITETGEVEFQQDTYAEGKASESKLHSLCAGPRIANAGDSRKAGLRSA